VKTSNTEDGRNIFILFSSFSLFPQNYKNSGKGGVCCTAFYAAIKRNAEKKKKS